jgi:hypothetical protein
MVTHAQTHPSLTLGPLDWWILWGMKIITAMGEEKTGEREVISNGGDT